jgi:hypothetical protein
LEFFGVYGGVAFGVVVEIDLDQVGVFGEGLDGGAVVQWI